MSARGRNGTADSPQAGAVPGDPANAAQSGAGRADAEAAEAAWRRLDPRIIAVTSTGSGLLIITAAVIMWWRDAPWWLHAAVPPPLLCFPVYEWWRW
ncbi:PH domain-containing protein [Streptomyces californicus]